MPATATDWRTRTASNQPQRRLRPVTVPNSWPRAPRRSPVSSLELGGEGALAYPRRIGLDDAEDVAARGRTHAGAGGGLAGDGVGGGDEGIGAVVDVQHHRLRALEQDLLLGGGGGVQFAPGGSDVGQELGA